MTRLLSERELAAAMSDDLRTFDTTVWRAPIRPTIPRRRHSDRFVTGLLVGCAIGVLAAFLATALWADTVARTEATLAQAQSNLSM